MNTNKLQACDIQSREPSSAARCENLFKANNKEKPPDQINKISETFVSTLKLASELLPVSVTEAFWDTVAQLAENNDSKILLSSSKMTLTKNFDNKVNFHSVYEYDTPSNSFVISKIEYTVRGKKRKLLTDSPIDPVTLKLKSDLLLNVKFENIETPVVNITEKINYNIYEKVLSEIDNLNLLTTHEISNLHKLSPTMRTVKYNGLVKGRRIKSYIVNSILNDLIINPLKTVTISFASVLIFSHSDYVKNLVSSEPVTPVWVAPAVVKMATVYPNNVQPEIIVLMKNISNQAASEKMTAQQTEKLNAEKSKSLEIDESDTFTIKQDSKKDKTYFLITREKENGQLEAYSTQINAAQYPQLIKYFDTHAAQ